MSRAYESKAAAFLEAGNRILITPELGRHRKPGRWSEEPSSVVVRQVTITEFHHVQIYTVAGTKYVVPESFMVKVAI